MLILLIWLPRNDARLTLRSFRPTLPLIRPVLPSQSTRNTINSLLYSLLGTFLSLSQLQNVSQHLAKISIMSGFATTILASPLQYCRVYEPQGADQCLAISTYHNETSNASDFYLLISAKFVDRGGFAAFGTGTTMDGSLMFVIYPGESKGGMKSF